MASSQSEEEREKIREKMRSDESLARILRQLDTGKGDEEEQNANSRTTRRNEQLQESSESADGQIAGHRKTLDLDELVFHDGSHFMSNKRCQLPDGSFRKQRKGKTNNFAAELYLGKFNLFFSHRLRGSSRTSAEAQTIWRQRNSNTD